MKPIYEADAKVDEPASDKIIRLQKTLGGAINGIWTAWARKAGSRHRSPWANINSDPEKNTAQLCEDFLRAWEAAGYDAYKMDVEHRLHVEWPTVMENHRLLLQRDRRTRAPKGRGSDGRPYPWAVSSNVAPKPPSVPDGGRGAAQTTPSGEPSGDGRRYPWS
eukprot:884071-Pyramimonas_sp.AAC.1